MHLALRSQAYRPALAAPDYYFCNSPPGLVGPPPLGHAALQHLPGRTLPEAPPARLPCASRQHPRRPDPGPASPAGSSSSPVSSATASPMAGRPSQAHDAESIKREALSAYHAGDVSSSGSDSKQTSAEAGSSSYAASAPGYAQPRKRPSRAGTRSVTTLSASQLERKRANDREAQRAIRARTKEHIESLERRVVELSSQGSQSEQLLASIKRQRELEEENQQLRVRLTQAQYSMSMSPESQEAAWAGSASILRTPISTGGLSMMPQAQLQTSISPTAQQASSRHDSAASHLGGWQDPAQTFGSPTSLRRMGASPTSYQPDISSLAPDGSSARRSDMSPVSSATASSGQVPQAMEYTYRPVMSQQYGSMQEPGPLGQSQQRHTLGADARSGSMHGGSSSMASYGAPSQQQQQPPSSAQSGPIPHRHSLPAATQQQQPHQQQHQSQAQHQPHQQQHEQQQQHQTPRYMQYGGPSPVSVQQPEHSPHPQHAPQHQHQHQHQHQQQPSMGGRASFTAQNSRQQQQQPPPPHQQQQNQSQMYYGHQGYGQ